MMEDGATMNSVQPSSQKLATGAESQAPGHSNTNVQVAGVDEADFIKNDGSYIYIVAAGKLSPTVTVMGPNVAPLGIVTIKLFALAARTLACTAPK